MQTIFLQAVTISFFLLLFSGTKSYAQAGKPMSLVSIQKAGLSAGQGAKLNSLPTKENPNANDVEPLADITIYERREGSSENPRIHVWSKETGVDVGITTWGNLPFMQPNPDGWFSYNVNKTQIGTLFLFNGLKTPDFKYYNNDIWVLLKSDGSLKSITPNNPDVVIPVNGVTLNPASISLDVNGSVQMMEDVQPSNATNKGVTWASSNPSVATVNSTGLVTGIAAGSATITVTTLNGGFTANSAVTVNLVEVVDINLIPTSASLAVNATKQIIANVIPSNASNKRINWTSSNNAVATVSATGVVTGKAVGNAVITATTVDGNFTATCTITVTPAIGITIHARREGTSENPKIHVWSKETGVDVGITTWGNLPFMQPNPNNWFSFNVTKTQIGTLFLYSNLKTPDFKYYDQDIWVLLNADGSLKSITNSNPDVIIPVSGVTLNPPSALIDVDATLPLIANILPANATNKNLIWMSLNTFVATVSPTGIVKGVNPGDAVIRVTTVDGNFTDFSTITVKAVNVTGVNIIPPSATVGINVTKQLTAVVLPLNATNKNVIWTSSNNLIATVSPNGLVTGKAVGTAIITATTVQGNFTATSLITVTPLSGITIHTRREGSTENPKIHVWSKETGVDVGITTWGNLPFMVPNPDGWFSYNVNKTQIGTLFLYTDIKTVDFKYYTEDVWILLNANGSAKSITNTNPDVVIPVTGVTLIPPVASIAVNGTLQLVATVQPANASNKNVTWLSDNPAVATVSATGLVTGKTPGSANITVTTIDGGFTDMTSVTVSTVNVTGVTVSPTTASIAVNATTQIVATVTPLDASNKNVVWTSSNNAVATVSATGLVTGKAIGNAVITATTVNGGFTASANITVTQPAGITIRVRRESSTENPKIHVWSKETGVDVGITTWGNLPFMQPNADGWFSYSVTKTQVGTLFLYTDIKTADFKYYNNDIWVLLNSSGNLISITNSNPDVITPVTGVTLTPSAVTLNVNAIAQLSATVLPLNASNKNVTWVSSNSSVATVSSSGLVTAKAVGSATITVKTVDGNFTETSVITVIPFAGITIHEKREGSSETPKIHVWSKETGSDVSITTWGSLPFMQLNPDGWYSYAVTKSEIGTLFLYSDIKTQDFKYYNQDVWILLNANGTLKSISFTPPIVKAREAAGNIGVTVNEIKLYPNPVGGVFNVSYPFEGEEKVNIRITSMLGQVVYESSKTVSGGYSEEFNTNSLKIISGTYFMTVQTSQGVAKKTFIVSDN